MESVEFFTSAPGLSDIFPIIPAGQYRANWMNIAKEDWIQNKSKFVNNRQTHIFQCPGIFDLFNYGYIVPLWHDLLIKTDGANRGYQWSIPSGALNAYRGKEVVGTHKAGIDKYIPKRPWSMEQFIKLDTPWNIIAPKGVKFLMLPVAYPDEFTFDSAIGILDPEISTEINVQLYWNNLKGDTLIRAGTPIAHLIPLTEKKYNLVVREMNDNDKKWVEKRNLMLSMFFRQPRTVIKAVYQKHFGK